MKLAIAALSMLLTAPFTQAANLHDELKTCAKLQDSQTRVVCYDNVVNGIDRYTETANTAKATVTTATTSHSKKKKLGIETITDQRADHNDDFGIEHKVVVKAKADKLIASVTHAKKSLRGKWIVTLENGQQWKQFDNTKFKLKAGEKVIIERGALNAFYLGKDDTNKRILIKRSK